MKCAIHSSILSDFIEGLNFGNEWKKDFSCVDVGVIFFEGVFIGSRKIKAHMILTNIFFIYFTSNLDKVYYLHSISTR